MRPEIPVIGMKVCETCGKRAHPFNTKCRYEDLVEHIRKIREANSTIPAILQANNEAVKSANDFKLLAKTAGDALEILERIVRGYPEHGEKIWTSYMEAVETWGNQISSRGTKDPLAILSHESTTRSETRNKLSTAPTQPGGNTAPDSLL